MILKSKQWLSIFLILLFTFLVTCFFVTKKMDPFYKYKARNQWDSYYAITQERYLDPGITKNFTYDTLLLGSSMIENTDMEYFRNKLNCNALKVSLAGLNIPETKQLLAIAAENSNLKKAYICVDVAKFALETEKSKIPDYLLKNDFFNNMIYSLNYESWFRYYPVNFVCKILDSINNPLVNKAVLVIKNRYGYLNFDTKDYWADNYEFGSEVVLDAFINGKYSVSEISLINLQERMMSYVDDFFADVNFDETDYVFFFPPYSILFWKQAEQRGYCDVFLNIKDYFIEKALFNGCTIYDFQSADFITDLDYYKDITHYSPEINNWMIDCFCEEENSNICNNYSLLKKITSYTIPN